jgi:hypothetical protein
VSLGGLLVICVILILGALIGLKVAPAYIEYGQIKKAVTGIVQGGEAKGTVADIRKAFERRAQVDDITTITAQDLDISKDGNDVVISFAYPKKVPLFANLSLLIDFAGSSRQ